MNALTICPCCSTPLLHHLGNHREYWFCRHCWQEMPDLGLAKHERQVNFSKIISLSASFSRYQPRLLPT